jgi:hypothetical protein
MTILAMVALAMAPAQATEFNLLQIEPSPVGARSMVLWPPSCPDPGSLALLFGPQGPISMPFVVRLGESDHWCDTFFPGPDITTEYLTGWSSQATVAFAEPAGHLAGPSNEEGYAGVLLPLRGGGYAHGPDAFRLSGPGIYCTYNLDSQLAVNSPDLNGDLVVNLSDVPLFAVDYFVEYNYRSDFFWDGQINLSDLGYLARAMGTYP